jgi:hypothetical protein
MPITVVLSERGLGLVVHSSSQDIAEIKSFVTGTVSLAVQTPEAYRTHKTIEVPGTLLRVIVFQPVQCVLLTVR